MHWQPRHGTQLLVFTDLDGTLLDHDTYSHAAARPALDRIARDDTPLIPVTSKTCGELLQLRRELHSHHPFVVENGAAIYLPVNYLPQSPAQCDVACGGAEDEALLVVKLGKPRQFWIDALQNIDTELGDCFSSFHAMGDRGIAATTGLPPERAALANQRQASEPLAWSGDEQQLDKFSTYIGSLGGQVIRGGRFLHVLSANCSKGGALDWLVGQYQLNYPDHDFRSVALGDAPNDCSMLEAADQAVLVRSKHHPLPELARSEPARVSEAFGPAGWNSCMLALMDQLQSDDQGL